MPGRPGRPPRSRPASHRASKDKCSLPPPGQAPRGTAARRPRAPPDPARRGRARSTARPDARSPRLVLDREATGLQRAQETERGGAGAAGGFRHRGERRGAGACQRLEQIKRPVNGSDTIVRRGGGLGGRRGGWRRGRAAGARGTGFGGAFARRAHGMSRRRRGAERARCGSQPLSNVAEEADSPVTLCHPACARSNAT